MHHSGDLIFCHYSFRSRRKNISFTWMTSMSCLRSSPSLKITPTGGTAMGDGMEWNSSHNGFFLEAITLHLSSWRKGIWSDNICLCSCNSISLLISIGGSYKNTPLSASFCYLHVLFSGVWRMTENLHRHLIWSINCQIEIARGILEFQTGCDKREAFLLAANAVILKGFLREIGHLWFMWSLALLTSWHTVSFRKGLDETFICKCYTL